jgi:hypothetical protein
MIRTQCSLLKMDDDPLLLATAYYVSIDSARVCIGWEHLNFKSDRLPELQKIPYTLLMNSRLPHILTTIIIALVWFVNGLFCKVLDLVPRHQEIVGRILGEQYAWLFTKAIGVSEILMAVWILSRIKSRFCAIFQIAIVGTMNIIEFILVPDVLLFGRMNIVFASFFIALIYINEFIFRKREAINQVV